MAGLPAAMGSCPRLRIPASGPRAARTRYSRSWFSLPGIEDSHLIVGLDPQVVHQPRREVRHAVRVAMGPPIRRYGGKGNAGLVSEHERDLARVSEHFLGG